MKKNLLLLLLAVLGFSACKNDDAPQGGSGEPAGKTETVALDLSGELDYPSLQEEGKALELVPGTNSDGKNVLSPRYADGDQVPALLYTTGGGKTSGPHPITMTVSGGGTRVSFKGDIAIDAATNRNGMRMAIFIGFKPDGTLAAYPTKAPHYPSTGVRPTITDYPIAFQCRQTMTKKLSNGVWTFEKLDLKFGMIGSIIRCTIFNDTDDDLSFRGLALNGLGATGMKIAPKPRDNQKEPYATSDDTDPDESSVEYLFDSPVVVAAHQKASHYLVYAPLVSGQDGRSLAYSGYISPLFSNANQAAEYSTVESARAFPANKAGKLALTTITIRKDNSPIRPNAIPLQYWNYNLYYKDPAGGAGDVISRQPRLFQRYAAIDGYESRAYFDTFQNPGKNIDVRGIFFRPGDVQESDVTGLGKGVHIPTAEELNGILPPDLITPAKSNLPIYYTSTAEYISDAKMEAVAVKDKRIAGKSLFWRPQINGVTGTVSEGLLSVLLWQGDLQSVGVYGIRFGKPTATEAATYTGDAPIVQDDKSRVAYAYLFGRGKITIFSRYIGEDSNIQTAQDVFTKEVFSKRQFNRYPIIRRVFYLYNAKYTTPEAHGGVAQHALLTRPNMANGTEVDTYYSGVDITSSVKVQLLTPPSGLVHYDKAGAGKQQVGTWIVRTKESYATGEPVYSYVYNTETKPVLQYTNTFIKDVPQDATHYFTFPLFLLSDKPSVHPDISGEPKE